MAGSWAGATALYVEVKWHCTIAVSALYSVHQLPGCECAVKMFCKPLKHLYIKYMGIYSYMQPYIHVFNCIYKFKIYIHILLHLFLFFFCAYRLLYMCMYAFIGLLQLVFGSRSISLLPPARIITCNSQIQAQHWPNNTALSISIISLSTRQQRSQERLQSNRKKLIIMLAKQKKKILIILSMLAKCISFKKSMNCRIISGLIFFVCNSLCCK